jgi:hypothetical protein
VTREIVRFNPTSEIDGEGAQYIRWANLSPIRLAFMLS